MICREHSLLDLYEVFLEDTKNVSFLEYPVGYPFMSVYEKNHTQIDELIINKYGSRMFMHYIKNLDNSDKRANNGDYQSFRKAINGAIYINAENYQKAYDVLLAEYKPLNNYDKQSEITETHNGSISKKSGSETDTTSKNGTETDTLSKSGKETDTLSKSGIERLTKSNGEKTDDITRKVSPENSENFFNIEKNINTYGIQTNTDTQEFVDRKDINVLSFENRKDVSEKSFVDRIDTNTRVYDTDDTVDFTIITKEKTAGNIGVTTSTQMMVSEYSERMKLNFLNDLIKEVIFEVTF